MASNREWFAPKMHGYGASPPIAWQGWVVLGAFVLGVLASVAWLPGVWRGVGVVAVSVLFGLVCLLTTKGGWRWRWGPD